MNTVVKPDLKSKSFSINNSYDRMKEKEIGYVDFKFYQKLFVVFISLSTFLIFPDSPRELENICESYNAKKLCNVW
tara:strand:+ start:244 stop:471 length:228 start_codon:yes stop_codon:yes gene_type:complete